MKRTENYERPRTEVRGGLVKRVRAGKALYENSHIEIRAFRMSGVMFDASVTAQPMKKDYAPPLLTIQKVVLENAVATPVSVQTLNGITQENDWGNESPLAPSEGDIWVDF